MINVTVWNECRHEKEDADVQECYPETIGGCIVERLKPFGFNLTSATLDDPEQGWPQERRSEAAGGSKERRGGCGKEDRRA